MNEAAKNLEAAPDYKYVGTRSIRPDGYDKVTGKARYGADYSLPGMLYGAILRSPHAHARIKSVDVSGALALPGVLAATCAEDLPELEGGMEDSGEEAVDFRDLSCNILARDKVLYHGHAVAAVAATSENAARAALKEIKVEYEVLPHVIDLAAAMAEDAPILHDDQFTQGLDEPATSPSNIASRVRNLHERIDSAIRSSQQLEL